MMDVLARPILKADHRIAYGPDPNQFGDLWLPEQRSKALFPVVVFYHGGWWRSEYDLGYAGYLCAALKKEGIAVWSVEYRRVGSTGGGWPTTFQDAGAGLDFVTTLAKTYPLDLARVFTMGHSAGGHLAFWIAGRHHVDAHSEIFQQSRVAVRGVIALAGVVDLRMTIDLSGYFTFAHDKQEVYALMGGRPEDVPDRYKAANPGDLLPLNAPQLVLQGTDDGQIPPELPAKWAARARSVCDSVTVSLIHGADHFDVVDPQSSAWSIVRDQSIKLILGSR